MDEDSNTEQKTWQVYSFGKINVFRLHLSVSGKSFCRRGSGRPFPKPQGRGPKTEMARERTVESRARNLEAESIRNRTDSMGRCVKLKTVTEIRRSSARERMSEVTMRFHCSLGGKILSDRTRSTELVVAGGLTDEVLHGQCAVEKNAAAFDRATEGMWYRQVGGCWRQ